MPYAQPPAKTEISDNYPKPSNAEMRTGMGKLWDYVTGLLGSSGNPKEARAALVVGVSPRVSGLSGKPHAAAPLVAYDLSADVVVLRDADGGTVARYLSGVKTVNLSTAGPVAQGRDQAAAFAANSWINLFFIWNGTALELIASTASHTTGPALPTGYTHWCYATRIRTSAIGQIVPGRMQGSRFWYDVNDSVTNRVLASGVATTMTPINLASLVPPNALRIVVVAMLVFTHNTGNFNFLLFLRPTGASTTGQVAVEATAQVAGVQFASRQRIEIFPGTSTQIDYKVSAVPSTAGGVFIDVDGYFVPNGDV